MIDLLKITRHIWEIKAFERLPDLGRRFDLVTSFAIVFNRHATPNPWHVDEWKFFLNDLACNHLKPDARLYFRLNPEPGSRDMDRNLKEFFLEKLHWSMGGQFNFQLYILYCTRNLI